MAQVSKLEKFIAANPSDKRVIAYNAWSARPIKKIGFRYPSGFKSLMADAVAA
ncbi:hypothetical protein C8J45_103339 [Sphingomonas sp. PP-CE-3G-477]|uniref:hypothetical protein n=1 Tax=Sphingomonas sp. PP-CE-3G-477 TaxID=2135660 RepID=UPI000D4F7F04|nr:hypothetical protein [Sphingomonas sp. PP-CE-3G-477]PTQ64489.1 hypothetical protein C8J45_103339 [Sphingomonas sp. PP-CE-3G-477]